MPLAFFGVSVCDVEVFVVGHEGFEFGLVALCEVVSFLMVTFFESFFEGDKFRRGRVWGVGGHVFADLFLNERLEFFGVELVSHSFSLCVR